MPTPIGHALGGLAAGVLVAGRTAPLVPVGKRSWSLLWVWALCGMLPDVDFLFGSHRGVTHTLGAMFAAGIVAAMIARRRPVVWGAVAASYGTHLLLDWFGADTVVPLGIMALWPFADTFYASPYVLFSAVCRQYWLVCCWTELIQTVFWELLLLGPVVAVALWFRRRR
ncbi:MAG TPA: hypothetical protein DEQ98_11940 [Acidobacteria bacterium]|jgi:membrane-bound metal-dependent hydrolase YbcI (DUF457 family)|nr:hypothetical protein [Acidobacteriota bacterium]HCE03938.1 hypothetical protein [Acidobacteriota bacterium]